MIQEFIIHAVGFIDVSASSAADDLVCLHQFVFFFYKNLMHIYWCEKWFWLIKVFSQFCWDLLYNILPPLTVQRFFTCEQAQRRWHGSQVWPHAGKVVLAPAQKSCKYSSPERICGCKKNTGDCSVSCKAYYTTISGQLTKFHVTTLPLQISCLYLPWQLSKTDKSVQTNNEKPYLSHSSDRPLATWLVSGNGNGGAYLRPDLCAGWFEGESWLTWR